MCLWLKWAEEQAAADGRYLSIWRILGADGRDEKEAFQLCQLDISQSPPTFFICLKSFLPEFLIHSDEKLT